MNSIKNAIDVHSWLFLTVHLLIVTWQLYIFGEKII